MVIEHADFEGIERLAVATGAELVSTFDQPQRGEEVLGRAQSIEEIMIGEDKFIKFNGCKSNKSCTIGKYTFYTCFNRVLGIYLIIFLINYFSFEEFIYSFIYLLI